MSSRRRVRPVPPRPTRLRHFLPALAMIVVGSACAPAPGDGPRGSGAETGTAVDETAEPAAAIDETADTGAVDTGATVDEAAVREELERLRTQFQTFVRTGDMRLLTPMLAEGAMMIPPAGNGWNEMLAAADETPFPIGSTIEMSPRELVVIDDEWAYEFGSSVFTWTPEDGEPEQLRDTYLILFRNQGDGWRIWREVASANLPPDVM